jgi:peroxiredoxin Q/BCP
MTIRANAIGRAVTLAALCTALLLVVFAARGAYAQAPMPASPAPPAAPQMAPAPATNAPAMAAADIPAVGAKAPDFTLSSEDGSPVSLRNYRGKWVVLYFYPKDFTSGCTIEAHSFQADLAQYQKINAVVLGVSVDSVDSHKDFCAKEGLNFKLLADTAHEVSAKYGSLRTMGANVMAARNTFLINPEGVIVKEFIGVNPTGHSQQVLAALADLQKTAQHPVPVRHSQVSAAR